MRERLSLSPLSRNTESCEPRSTAGAGSHQQFPFLNSSPIHFSPTWGWPTITSGRAPAQTSPTSPPVTCILGTKNCCIFNFLWQSHPTFHSGTCHQNDSPLSLPLPLPQTLLPGIPRATGTCLVAHSMSPQESNIPSRLYHPKSAHGSCSIYPNMQSTAQGGTGKNEMNK